MVYSYKGISKVLQGIYKYQKSLKGELVPLFREILDKPAPKSIILTCVDSRVVASRLLQAEPGAYFMIRTPANFIPKFEDLEKSTPSAIPAALELACVNNKANTIAVIGHSDCKTLNLLYSMRNDLNESTAMDSTSELKKWLLENGKESLEKLAEFQKSDYKKPLKFIDSHNREFVAHIDPDNQLSIKDKFSQINTLEQLKNLNKYAFLKDRFNKNVVKGYALWMDVFTSEVFMFSFIEKRFVKIDESSYEKLYKECQTDAE